MPAFSAIRTRSATDWAPIFFMIDARWTLMVFSAVSSLSAIFLFGRPVMTQTKTSCSFGVRVRIRASSSFNSSRCASSCLHRSMALYTASSRSCSSKGFWRKSRAPAFMARTLIGTVPWPETKMMGSRTPARGQFLLQLESADFRHPHIENQAARLLPVAGLQKLRGRGKGFCREAHGLDEPLQGPPDGRIVVHNENDRFYVLHVLTPLAKGTREGKLWPPRPGCSRPVSRPCGT